MLIPITPGNSLDDGDCPHIFPVNTIRQDQQPRLLESSRIDPTSLNIWHMMPFDFGDPLIENVRLFQHYVYPGIRYAAIPWSLPE